MKEPPTALETARRSPVQPKGLHIAEYVLLAALMAFVVLMCWPWMTHLGVDNDEAHFFPQAAKIAAGSPESEHFPSGLYLFHRPFPFMTAAYIGAFDAYLYGLVFAVFGISPLVYRVTNLVLSLLLIALAYGLARSLYGRVAAIFAAALLVSDAEFLLHTPTNFGPILVQMLCATVSVLLLQKWIEGSAPWHLPMAAFLLGLAFTEKLTFVLFVAGLLVSLACFYAKPILARLTIRSSLQAGAAFVLGCLPILICTVGSFGVVFGFGRENTGSPAQWAAALAQRPAQFKSLLTGQFSLSVMSGIDPGVGRFSMLWAGFWFALACCVAGAILCRVRPSLRAWAPPRVVGFLLCLCAGIVISSAFFTESGRVHHLMLTYPFVQCAVAVTLAWICTLAAKTSRAVRILLPILLAVPVFATGASTVANLRWLTQEVVKTGGRGHWSSEMYRLVEWVRGQPDTHFVFMSWGMYREVFAFSGGKCSCREYYFQLLAPELSPSVQEEVRTILKRRNSIFVFSRIMPSDDVTAWHMFALAGELNLHPRLVKTFRHPYDGSVLYEAYSLEVPEETRWRPMALEGLKPVQYKMQEFSMTGPSPIVLRGGAEPSEVVCPMGFQLPLTSAGDRFRFRASSESWPRFTDFNVQLQASGGGVLRNWERNFYWNPMIGRELSVEVGPDLYPDFFSHDQGKEGAAASLKVFVHVKGGSGPVDLAISGLETGSVSR